MTTAVCKCSYIVTILSRISSIRFLSRRSLKYSIREARSDKIWSIFPRSNVKVSLIYSSPLIPRFLPCIENVTSIVTDLKPKWNVIYCYFQTETELKERAYLNSLCISLFWQFSYIMNFVLINIINQTTFHFVGSKICHCSGPSISHRLKLLKYVYYL